MVLPASSSYTGYRSRRSIEIKNRTMTKKMLTFHEKMKIYREVDRDLCIDFDVSNIQKKFQQKIKDEDEGGTDILMCGSCNSHFRSVDKFVDHQKNACQPKTSKCGCYMGRYTEIHCKLCSITLHSAWEFLTHIYHSHSLNLCIEYPKSLDEFQKSSPIVQTPVSHADSASLAHCYHDALYDSDIDIQVDSEAELSSSSAKQRLRTVSFSARDEIRYISPRRPSPPPTPDITKTF